MRTINSWNGCAPIICAIAFVAICTSSAPAAPITATYTNGSGDGLWGTARNWDVNQVPNNGGGNTFNVILNTGAVTLNVDPTVDGYTQSGTNITAFLRPIAVTGAANWSAGSITGQGGATLTAQGGITLGALPNGQTAPTLISYSLSTPANTTSSIAGNTLFGSNTTYRSNGTFNFTDDSSIKLAAGAFGTPTILLSNTSILAKTGGNGTSTIEWQVSNDGGTLMGSSGTLSLTGDYFQSNNGKLIAGAGATISSVKDLSVDRGGGIITGAGTIKAPNVKNNALIRGAPTGLTIDGDLSLGTFSTFDTPVGGIAPIGTTPGDYADFIYVTGNVTLGGNLQVEFFPGFIADPSDVFELLDADGMLTGAFANAPDGSRINTADGLGSFQVHYESSPYQHEVVIDNFSTALVPVPWPAAAFPGMMVLLVIAFAFHGRRHHRGKNEVVGRLAARPNLSA